MAQERGGERSHPGLDAYRGVAVVAMYAVHARRLQSVVGSEDAGFAESALRALMWAEPFIAASFLFIVGFSLVLARSHYSSPRTWLRRMGRRAAELYVLSVLLFIPHYGLQWPDGLLSPGILSAIAVAILLVGGALASPRPALLLGAVAAAGLGVTAGLEAIELSLSGLNGGPGGGFPLVAFAAAGALAARLEQRAGTRALALAVAVSALPFVIALVTHRAWTTTHTSVYADYGDSVAVLALLDGSPTTTVAVPFWNHSAAGALALWLPLGLSLLLFIVPQRRTASWWPLHPVRLLGRHALAAYVGHLVVLGVLTTAQLTPPSAAWTWTLVALLAVGAGVGAAGWERRQVRRRSRADG